jgi:hypothetical protein
MTAKQSKYWLTNFNQSGPRKRAANQGAKTMEKYIVVASYIGRSNPMQYVDAAQLILSYRAAGIACHIEEVK